MKEAEILHSYDSATPVYEMTDACLAGIGAVLYNKVDNRLKTVWCVSATLFEAENSCA